MARLYSVKDFYRQTPNALVARYFAARGLFAGLGFAAMKECKPDTLIDGRMSVPAEARRRTDAHFRDIEGMSKAVDWSSDLMERALSQTVVGVRGRYERANCGIHGRDMLQFWADYTQQLMITGTVMLTRAKQVA